MEFVHLSLLRIASLHTIALIIPRLQSCAIISPLIFCSLHREGIVGQKNPNINLFRSMDFRAVPVTVDIAALVARFADTAFWNKSLQDEIEVAPH